MGKKLFSSSNQGFTLIEVLVVILIIGVLGAIAVPSWLKLINDQRLKAAEDRIYWAMRSAQSNATRDKITWQASFKDDGVVKFAIHSSAGSNYPNLNWQTLDSNIRIVDTDAISSDPNGTTLYFDRTARIWRVQFNYKGNPNGQLGKITLSYRSTGRSKRCILVSTLIGSMRRDKDEKCTN